ncbi:MAG: polyisoprenoid-binding protein [Chloroflexi bacterium]|nr:MAG: polyisoprenoid-binding protein [Chloroflexota bacterium]
MQWQIDPTHSLIEFSVKHMMIATVRGRFTRFEGQVHLDPKNPEASYAEGSVDVSSIDTREPDRDAHLRSADFFDVEKFPRMTFRSTRVERVEGNRYRVAGELTIKDVTREVVFDVTDGGRMKDPWGNIRWGVSAVTRISRKDFGLTWNVALEAGGWLVGDDIKIEAELEAVLVQEQEQVQA